MVHFSKNLEVKKRIKHNLINLFNLFDLLSINAIHLCLAERFYKDVITNQSISNFLGVRVCSLSLILTFTFSFATNGYILKFFLLRSESLAWWRCWLLTNWWRCSYNEKKEICCSARSSRSLKPIASVTKILFTTCLKLLSCQVVSN